MENKKSKTKQTNTKPAKPLKANDSTKKVIKVDYKKELEKVKKELKLVKEQRDNFEKDIKKNLMEFQLLAKSFQDKAQIQINEKKKEVAEKLEEEKIHIKRYGSQKLLESLVEPLLNIEVAINAGKNNEAVSAYVMGFEMLLNQIYQELESYGVTVIEPKVGEEFNPELHQILNFTEEKGKKNTISKVRKKGFKLHNRVFKVSIVDSYK